MYNNIPNSDEWNSQIQNGGLFPPINSRSSVHSENIPLRQTQYFDSRRSSAPLAFSVNKNRIFHNLPNNASVGRGMNFMFPTNSDNSRNSKSRMSGFNFPSYYESYRGGKDFREYPLQRKNMRRSRKILESQTSPKKFRNGNKFSWNEEKSRRGSNLKSMDAADISDDIGDSLLSKRREMKSKRMAMKLKPIISKNKLDAEFKSMKKVRPLVRGNSFEKSDSSDSENMSVHEMRGVRIFENGSSEEYSSSEDNEDESDEERSDENNVSKRGTENDVPLILFPISSMKDLQRIFKLSSKHNKKIPKRINKTSKKRKNQKKRIKQIEKDEKMKNYIDMKMNSSASKIQKWYKKQKQEKVMKREKKLRIISEEIFKKYLEEFLINDYVAEVVIEAVFPLQSDYSSFIVKYPEVGYFLKKLVKEVVTEMNKNIVNSVIDSMVFKYLKSQKKSKPSFTVAERILEKLFIAEIVKEEAEVQAKCAISELVGMFLFNNKVSKVSNKIYSNILSEETEEIVEEIFYLHVYYPSIQKYLKSTFEAEKVSELISIYIFSKKKVESEKKLQESGAANQLYSNLLRQNVEEIVDDMVQHHLYFPSVQEYLKQTFEDEKVLTLISSYIFN